jgi:homoserine dehydrogenase
MKIGLLGHGTVGGGVTRIIDRHDTEETKDLEVVKILVKDDSELTDERCTTEISDILNDPQIDTVCECMGGIEPAHSYVKSALENGKNAVTSNKKMLAETAEDLFDTARQHQVKLLYEASVGGGIPWMAELRRTRRIDEITSFQGIFNGTTNYILTRMGTEGKDFDEMLKEAQMLGYAEHDPTDDIDGYDVRYKTALTSLSAFDAYIKPEDIITWGIRSVKKEDFTYAESIGRTVKLIGQGDRDASLLSLHVMPVMVKRDSLFANVPLNYNAIESDSPTLGKAVYIGQGAGSLPTANAVVQDLIDLKEGNIHHEAEMHAGALSSADYMGVFYVRSRRLNLFENVKDRQVGDNAILTRKISLVDVNMLAKSAGDDSLFLAEVQA